MNVVRVIRPLISLFHCCGERKRHNSSHEPQKATIVILATLFVSLAEDFKTGSGKIYKDATISRVEADRIVLRTKTGISRVYFADNVQQRFTPK